MNEQLSKEQRRNLRKEMGATAADALEKARAEVLKLMMANGVLARELAELKDSTARDIVRLAARIDGASAWCEKNEQAAVRNERLAGAIIESTTHAAERFNSVIHGSFWVRLRWALWGVVPWSVERDRQSAAVAAMGPMVAQQGAESPYR